MHNASQSGLGFFHTCVARLHLEIRGIHARQLLLLSTATARGTTRGTAADASAGTDPGASAGPGAAVFIFVVRVCLTAPAAALAGCSGHSGHMHRVLRVRLGVQSFTVLTLALALTLSLPLFQSHLHVSAKIKLEGPEKREEETKGKSQECALRTSGQQ